MNLKGVSYAPTQHTHLAILAETIIMLKLGLVHIMRAGLTCTAAIYILIIAQKPGCGVVRFTNDTLNTPFLRFAAQPA